MRPPSTRTSRSGIRLPSRAAWPSRPCRTSHRCGRGLLWHALLSIAREQTRAWSMSAVTWVRRCRLSPCRQPEWSAA